MLRRAGGATAHLGCLSSVSRRKEERRPWGASTSHRQEHNDVGFEPEDDGSLREVVPGGGAVALHGASVMHKCPF